MGTAYRAANSLVTWKRQTSFLLDPVDPQASGHVPDRQPIRKSTVIVTVTLGATGTVIVNGTLDGAPVSQTLTWNGVSDINETTQLFDVVTSLDNFLSWAAGAKISAKAGGGAGQPQHSLTTIRGPGWPVTREDVGGRGPQWPGNRAGHSGDTPLQRFIVGYEESWRPRRGDIVIEDSTGTEFIVLGVREAGGTFRPNEWHVNAKERADSQGL